MKNKVYLILPRDLGDCVIASQHVKKVVDYCSDQQKELVIWGGGFQANLFKIFADIDIKPSEVEDAPHAEKVIDFNFYQTDLFEHFPKGTPIFSADKIFEAPYEGYLHEGRAVGAGCLIGKDHIYNSLGNALKQAGIACEIDDIAYPTLPQEITNNQFQETVLKDLNITKPYAALVPVCAPTRPNKRWQPEKYAEIAKKLAAQGIKPLIIGGPAEDEKELTQKINHLSGDVGQPVHIGVKEISAVLSGAELTLSNDTGMLHISAASHKTPTFLVGDNWYISPETWQPLQNNFQLISVPNTSVKDLSVHDVWSQLKVSEPEMNNTFKARQKRHGNIATP